MNYGNSKMIISKSPYRVSFFGGGTDYEDWYKINGGLVLSSTLDKFVYVTLKESPNIYDHSYRIVWNRIEERNSIYSIQNPIIKECLLEFNVQQNLEIHYHGDLPAKSGLGSSSSFCSALVSALYKKLFNVFIPANELAEKSILIEREKLNESGGIQDQIAVSYGGLNQIKINQNGSFSVFPINLNKYQKDDLNSHCLFFFTNTVRNSSDIASNVSATIQKKDRDFHEMTQITQAAIDNLKSSFNIKELGKLMQQAWEIKNGFHDSISNSDIDDMISTGIKNGAYGGKLLGAGGGGVVLFLAPPDLHDRIISSMYGLPLLKMNLGSSGNETFCF